MLRHLLAGSIATLALSSMSAIAAVLTVAQEGAGQYETIQEAINAANNGDAISIAANTELDGDGELVPYAGFNTIGKILTINGPDGAVDTFIGQIAGEDSVPLVSVISGEHYLLIISNLTFKGSTAAKGGGIYIAGSSPTFDTCIITGCAAEYGGGLYALDSETTITNCTFSGNLATFGSGLYAEDCDLTITDTTFDGNGVFLFPICQAGGGLMLSGGTSTLNSCTITGNDAQLSIVTRVWAGGGGLWCGNGATPTLTDCEITGNIAWYGGGIACGLAVDHSSDNGTTSDGADAILENCTISFNQANYGGGVVVANASMPSFTACEISGNMANFYGGGVLAMNDQPDASNTGGTFLECSIVSNNAIQDGGGIYTENTSIALTDCTITDNTAQYDGAGIFVDEGNPTFSNCDISGHNSAYGGSIFALDADLVIDGGSITDSIAWIDGGGIFQNGGSLTATSVDITNNSAIEDGGGIRVVADATISLCTFKSNLAIGDDDARGGAIYVGGNSSAITGCDFTTNDAVRGAAIFLASGELSIDDASLLGNTAEWGGVIDAAEGMADLSHSDFVGNAPQSIYGNWVDGGGNLFGDTATVAWRNTTTGENVIWTTAGAFVTDGQFLSSVADTHWEVVGSGNFDRNDSIELMWRNSMTGQNAFWGVDGVSLAGSGFLPTVSLAWSIAAVADLNGDGFADIVWRNESTGENAVWLLKGTAFAGAGFFTSVIGDAWQIAGAGNYDASIGGAPIFWYNTESGQVNVWVLSGVSVISTEVLGVWPDLAWKIVTVDDLDGNGSADLLWRKIFSGSNEITYLDGTSVLDEVVIDSQSAPWQCAGAVGVTGLAGRIYWKNPSTGENQIWIIDDGEAVLKANLTAVPDTSWSIVGID